MFIYGGKSNGYHADLYRFNFNKERWSAVPYMNKPPLARYGHSLCHVNGNLYIFGGYDQHGFCCDELYKFSLETSLWERIKFSPLPQSTDPQQLARFHHTACAYGNKLIIFGGKGPETPRGDLCEFDIGMCQWFMATLPIS